MGRKDRRRAGTKNAECSFHFGLFCCGKAIKRTVRGTDRDHADVCAELAKTENFSKDVSVVHRGVLADQVGEADGVRGSQESILSEPGSLSIAIFFKDDSYLHSPHFRYEAVLYLRLKFWLRSHSRVLVSINFGSSPELIQDLPAPICGEKAALPSGAFRLIRHELLTRCE